MVEHICRSGDVSAAPCREKPPTASLLSEMPRDTRPIRKRTLVGRRQKPALVRGSRPHERHQAVRQLHVSRIDRRQPCRVIVCGSSRNDTLARRTATARSLAGPRARSSPCFGKNGARCSWAQSSPRPRNYLDSLASTAARAAIAWLNSLRYRAPTRDPTHRVRRRLNPRSYLTRSSGLRIKPRTLARDTAKPPTISLIGHRCSK